MGLAVIYTTSAVATANAETFLKFFLDIITGNTSNVQTLDTNYPTVGVNTGSSFIIGSNSTIGNWTVTPGQWVNTGYSAGANQRAIVQIEAPCVNTSFTKYGIVRLTNTLGNATPANNNYNHLTTFTTDGVSVGQNYNEAGLKEAVGISYERAGYYLNITGLVSNVEIGDFNDCNNIPNAFAGSNTWSNTTILNANNILTLTPDANNESFRVLTKTYRATSTPTSPEGAGNTFSNAAVFAHKYTSIRPINGVNYPLVISWSKRHLFTFVTNPSAVYYFDYGNQQGLFEYPEVPSQISANVSPMVAVNIPGYHVQSAYQGGYANTVKNIASYAGPTPMSITTGVNWTTTASGTGAGYNYTPPVVSLMGGQTWDGYRWNTPLQLLPFVAIDDVTLNSSINMRFPSTTEQPVSNTRSYMTYGAGLTNIVATTDDYYGISNYRLFLDDNNNNKYVATPIFFTVPKFNINYASLSDLSQVWYAPSGGTNQSVVNIGSNTYFYVRATSGSIANSSVDTCPYYFLPYF